MKKIALIINVFREHDFKSGGEKLFYELVKGFIKSNYIVDLYCSRYFGKSDKPDIQGINEIIVIGKASDYRDPEIMESLYDQIKDLIKNKNYDYVLAENITPPIDMVFLQGHSFAYRSEQGTLLDNIILKTKKSKHLRYQKKWLSNGYKQIFVPSNVLKRDIMENFNISKDRITVIYPGVDCPEGENLPEKSAVRDKFTFGISATSFKNKGGYLLLNAVKLLKSENLDFKVRIIYPKYKKNLFLKAVIKLYNIEKYIEFLPFQDNMYTFYQSIDCLIVPSLVETFGLVVLEAMINHRICIVGNKVGASEILEDEIDGFIFNMEQKPDAYMAAKMKLIINNRGKLEQYYKNAYSKAEKFSWGNTYKNLESHLNKGIKDN